MQSLTTPDAGTNASPTLLLNKIDLAVLSDEAHEEYLAHSNRLRAESHPDDPPRPIEDHLARRRNVPHFVHLHNWEIRDTALPGNPLIGFGELQIGQQQTNRNIASFWISVLPERRREGVARRLLLPIATCARENERTLLMTGSTDHVPAGEQFLQSLEAERGLESCTNQLVLSEIDPGFLTTYREESARRGAGEFELIWCNSPFPEELLAPAALLGNLVARDIPLGALEMEPHEMTPEEVRELDQVAIASGATNLVLIARDKTGTFAGLTMMTWGKHMPYMTHQGITGVLPEYRGRGLARYLKATMLEQIREKYPEVRFVRTDNADSNAAMLTINRSLGFRKYRSETMWQIPTERAIAYATA